MDRQFFRSWSSHLIWQKLEEAASPQRGAMWEGGQPTNGPHRSPHGVLSSSLTTAIAPQPTESLGFFDSKGMGPDFTLLSPIHSPQPLSFPRATRTITYIQNMLRGWGPGEPGKGFKAACLPLTPVQVELKLLCWGQSCQNKVKGVKTK